MHGFLIHTVEGNLMVRNYDYIKFDNPGWWQDNLYMIANFWEFDSDKKDQMKAIFHSLVRISNQGRLTKTEVELFCESINFDLEKFMEENATPEAHFVKVVKQNWDHSDKSAATGFGTGTVTHTPKSGSD